MGARKNREAMGHVIFLETLYKNRFGKLCSRIIQNMNNLHEDNVQKRRMLPFEEGGEASMQKQTTLENVFEHILLQTFIKQDITKSTGKP